MLHSVFTRLVHQSQRKKSHCGTNKNLFEKIFQEAFECCAARIATLKIELCTECCLTFPSLEVVGDPLTCDAVLRVMLFDLPSLEEVEDPLTCDAVLRVMLFGLPSL